MVGNSVSQLILREQEPYLYDQFSFQNEQEPWVQTGHLDQVFLFYYHL